MELAYREAGSGDLAVVLLHAFPLSSAMWLEQREALATSYRVVTPDLRGFGGSSLGEDPPSVDASADDVAELLDRLGLDQVVLAGLSMGGYVAMAFLRRHSDRLAGLVLVDTKAAADPEAGRAGRLAMAERLEADPDSDVLATDVLPRLLGVTTVRERPLVTGRVRGLVRAAPAPAAAWAQRAMAARPDSFDTLRSAACPALVVVGEEDELSPVADAQAMAEALPDARLAVLPGAGHLSPVETPEAFTAELTAFLQGLPRR